MEIKKLTKSVELIAAFSIVVSLMFVGFQIMQEREIAQIESVVAAVEGKKYMAELIGEHGDIWVKGLAGAALTDTEKAVFKSLALAYDIDIYGSWYRASQLKHVNADRFPYQYALFLLQNRGLLAHWRETTKEAQMIRTFTRSNFSVSGRDFDALVAEAMDNIQSSGVLDD